MPKPSKKPLPDLDNRHVSTDALDWALRHVYRHGDTDVFPVPFEYRALTDQWSSLLGKLTARNIAKMPLRPQRVWPVPKPYAGFRIAHQLDPLDTLLYTALVYEMGHHIEQARQKKNIACAYRFRPNSAGDFFPRDNGWGTFTLRSRKLAKRYSYVLHVDIADFYNQIYHHRLVGALETAGVPSERANNFESYIGKFTAWQTRGIPVGPSASNLLAECCLTDVDAYLRAKGIPFVRYIDDFRLFANSRRKLIGVLHDLTNVLYTNHRLAVQSGKTYIQSSTDFIDHNLEDPERILEWELEGRLEELVDQLNEDTGYEISIDEVSAEHVDEEMENCLTSLLEQSLRLSPIRFGTIRFVLREAGRIGSERVGTLVAEQLEPLAPIIGDVSRYLRKVVPTLTGRETRRLGDALLRLARKSDYAKSTYVAICALDLLTAFPQLTSFRRAIALADANAARLGIRPQALLANAHGQAFWVRQHKEHLMEHGPWERRALIWAASALPASERRIWLGKVLRRLDDRLDIALAEQVVNT